MKMLVVLLILGFWAGVRSIQRFNQEKEYNINTNLCILFLWATLQAMVLPALVFLGIFLHWFEY